MKISLTKGIFVIIVLLFKIVAASIGRVAFFEPEILILPDKIFSHQLIIFALEIKSLAVLHLFVSYICLFFYHR